MQQDTNIEKKKERKLRQNQISVSAMFNSSDELKNLNLPFFKHYFNKMQQTVSSHRITPGFLWFLIQLDSRKNYYKVFNNPYIIVNLVMLWYR